jgi:NhaP-type Na+/H+ or K+/H+ antiporter
MPSLPAESFITTLALIGVVIGIAALFSGAVERVRAPEVVVFLLLGLALGSHGLGLVHLPLESTVLAAIATLALVLVLFIDAVAVDTAELRAHRRLALLVLGPGTVLTAAIVGVAAWLLLGLPPAAAAILGAALASTDPVLMRSLLRRGEVVGAARQALRIESGLNDAVLLPVVLVAMLLLGGRPADAGWGRLAIDLFLLGPGAGVVVGFVGVAALDQVRRRVGVRRDYESLYAIGLALTAYAAAEAVHGSGFLAAFAAGLTIAVFDAELCDCFLDFGQAAAEVFLLFTFVALGSSAIWVGLDALSWRAVAFTAIALVARSAVLALALARAPLDARSRRLIVWFGPRGLSTLLLVLLPVFAGLPGAADLFAYAALVVLASLVVHGGGLMLVRGTPAAPAATPTPAPAAPAGPRPAVPERITLDELRRLQQAGEPVHVLDVRTERSYRDSEAQAAGALRVPPDDAVRRAAELALPRHDWLVAYCA